VEATAQRRALAGWAVVMVLFWATTAVESLSWVQLTAFTPLYLLELGVHNRDVPAWTSWMSSLGWALALPLAPFWGVWADRYSRKAIIVRSAVAEAVIFGGWALSTTPLTALLFRCLNGFVLGNTGVMLAVQASTTPPRRLGLAIGMVSAGGPAGVAAGPALGALLIRFIDVRGMLLVDAVAALVMAVLLTVLIREPPRERPVGVSAVALLRGAVAEITGHPLIWRLFLAMGLAMLGTWVLIPFQPIYVAGLAAPGQAAAAVGLVLSATGVAGALASPAWGQLVDRFGHLNVLTLTSPVAAAALLVAGVVPGLIGFAAFLILYSIFNAAALTAVSALMARVVSPERRGAVLGQIYMPFYVAGLIGPLVGGALFPAGRWALFAVAAATSVLALGVVLTGRRAVSA
jgi:MFS family permease